MKDSLHDYENLEQVQKCGAVDDMGRLYQGKCDNSRNICCLSQDECYKDKNNGTRCAPNLKRDRIDELFDKTDKKIVKKLGTSGYDACLNYNKNVACPKDSVCFKDSSKGGTTTCAMRRKNVVSKDYIVESLMSLDSKLTIDDISLEMINSIKELTEDFIANEVSSNSSKTFSVSQINAVVKEAAGEAVNESIRNKNSKNKKGYKNEECFIDAKGLQPSIDIIEKKCGIIFDDINVCWNKTYDYLPGARGLNGSKSTWNNLVNGMFYMYYCMKPRKCVQDRWNWEVWTCVDDEDDDRAEGEAPKLIPLVNTAVVGVAGRVSNGRNTKNDGKDISCKYGESCTQPTRGCLGIIMKDEVVEKYPQHYNCEVDDNNCKCCVNVKDYLETSIGRDYCPTK